jgi:hypothetical protein
MTTWEQKRRSAQAASHKPQQPYSPRADDAEERWQTRRRAEQAAQYSPRPPLPAPSAATTRQLVEGLRKPHD